MIIRVRDLRIENEERVNEAGYHRRATVSKGPRFATLRADAQLSPAEVNRLAESHGSGLAVEIVEPTPRGARSVLACDVHEDCREHPEVGVACWRERAGH